MQARLTGRDIDILLVEDNKADVWLVTHILAEAKAPCRLSTVEDGVEATEFLHQRGRYADAPNPDLILLDLNLPRKTGNEVLEEIKMDPTFRRIPVIIFTSSKSEIDVNRAYQSGANAYMMKPNRLEDMQDIVNSLANYWMTAVALPSKPEPKTSETPEGPIN